MEIIFIIQVILLTSCMLSFALPVNKEAIHQTSPDNNHLRLRRDIVFRPLFVYRQQQQAQNHHPVHRRHIIEPSPIDRNPINQPYHQNAYPEVYSYYPYRI